MIVLTILINFLITIFNFYLVLRLWQFRRLLKLLTSALDNCESYLTQVFILSPQILAKQQASIYLFRQQYQLLQLQLLKIKQLLTLLNGSIVCGENQIFMVIKLRTS